MCRNTAVVLALASVVLAAGCGRETCVSPQVVGVQVIGSGRVASEARPAASFTSIVVDGPLHVELQAGASPSLVVTAEDNLLPLVRSELRGESLHLFLDPVSLTSTRELLVRVASPELRSVEGNGAARVEVDGVALETLTTTLSGASSVRLSGRAEEHRLRLSGASRCEAAELRSRAVSAWLSGASYGIVRASSSLAVDASGASTLEYLGDPQLTSSVSGQSLVRRVGP